MSRVARSYQICKSREADIERDQLAMGAMAEVCKRRVRRWADGQMRRGEAGQGRETQLRLSEIEVCEGQRRTSLCVSSRSEHAT